MRSKEQTPEEELLELSEKLKLLIVEREQIIHRIDRLPNSNKFPVFDRHDIEVELGCTVHLLTSGRYSFKTGTVIKIGKLLTIKGPAGQTTTRKPRNVEVTEGRGRTQRERTLDDGDRVGWRNAGSERNVEHSS